MALNLGELYVTIGAHTAPLVKATKALPSLMATAGDKAGAAMGHAFMNKFTAVLGAGALGAGLVGAIKKAMGAQESENLFEVSMGRMSASARKWSEELRKATGLNDYAIRENIGTFNVMFTSMGLGEKAALGMSEGLTKLAYDMASFYNMKPEEAFEKLRAGITGEAEPLKRLGILVGENSLKQYGYNVKMSEGEKVAVRYKAIMMQTVKASGDLERTKGSLTNQVRIFNDQVARASITLGNQLLPGLTKIVGKMNDWLDLHGDEYAKKIGDGFAWIVSHKDGLLTTATILAGMLVTMKGMALISAASAGASIVSLAAGGAAAAGGAGAAVAGGAALGAGVASITAIAGAAALVVGTAVMAYAGASYLAKLTGTNKAIGRWLSPNIDNPNAGGNAVGAPMPASYAARMRGLGVANREYSGPSGNSSPLMPIGRVQGMAWAKSARESAYSAKVGDMALANSMLRPTQMTSTRRDAEGNLIPIPGSGYTAGRSATFSQGGVYSSGYGPDGASQKTTIVINGLSISSPDVVTTKTIEEALLKLAKKNKSH